MAWWGVAGLLHTGASAVSVSLAGLHWLVAGLFLVRRRERRAGSVGCIAAAMPALVAGAAVGTLAPPPSTWSALLQAVFVIGTVWVAITLATLGRSFALLPGLREVVTRGPYRLVRHPAYAGEVLMIAAASGAIGGLWSLAGAAFVVALLMVRILAEERVLLTDPAYVEYARRVPSRLVPGIW